LERVELLLQHPSVEFASFGVFTLKCGSIFETTPRTSLNWLFSTSSKACSSELANLALMGLLREEPGRALAKNWSGASSPRTRP
jgi:hypothetical protein